MNNNLQFIISLKDMMSGTLKKVEAITKVSANNMLTNIQRTSLSWNTAKKSVDQLRSSIEAIEAKRNAIQLTKPEDVIRLRVMNSELKKMEQSMNKKLTMNGSKMATWTKEAVDQLPFAGLIKNPLVMAGAAAAYSVKQAMDVQAAHVKFGTLLGDDKKGLTAYNQLKGYADVTPYSKDDILKSGETMLNYGVNSQKMMGYVKQLGDISGGSAERLQSLSLAFGQIYAKGHLAGQEVLQMVNAGFNPLQEISRTTGKSMNDLDKMMRDGAISVQMVTNAMESATGSGGRFHGMMEKLGQTLQGQLSTFMDRLNNSAADLGSAIMPVANSALQLLNSLIGFLKNNLKAIVVPLAIVAAGLALAKTEAIGMSIGFRWAALKSSFLEGSLLKLRTTILEAFATNPITMWIAVIGAAVAIFYSWYKSSNEYFESLKKKREALDQLISRQGAVNRIESEGYKNASENIHKAKELINTINGRTGSEEFRKNTLKELIGLDKEHFGGLKTIADVYKNGESALQKYTEAMYKHARALAAVEQIKDSNKQLLDREAEVYGQESMNLKNSTKMFGGHIIKLSAAEAAKNIQAAVNSRMGNKWKDLTDKNNYIYDTYIKGDKSAMSAYKGTDSLTNTNTDDEAKGVVKGGPRVINIYGVKLIESFHQHLAGKASEGFGEMEGKLNELLMRLLYSGAKMQDA
jgi:tape measure domain-containing protein